MVATCRDNNRLNHHHRQESRVKVAGTLEGLKEAISSSSLQLCKLLQLADKNNNCLQVEPLPTRASNYNNPNKLKLSIHNNTICILSLKYRLWAHQAAKPQQPAIFKNRNRGKEHREEAHRLPTRHRKLKANQTSKLFRL